MKKWLRVVVWLYCFYFSGIKGQQNTSGESVPDTVLIEIGYRGLHCPFLGPQLKRKIEAMEDVRLVEFDTDKSYLILYYYGERSVNEEFWLQIVESAGYHREYAKVKISSRSSK